MSLAALMLKSLDRPQKGRLRISQAGRPCVRELYLVASGVPGAPTEPKGLVKMGIGSALDAYALKGEHDGWRFQVPVAVTMGAVTVNGSADAVYYGEGDTAELVSDLKTVGGSTWAKVQREPKQEHRAQVQLYAYGLGAPRWSLLYVNADTGEMLEHFGEVDVFAARKDFGLFEEASYWLGRGEPPPRPYDDIEEDDGKVKLAKDQFPCRFCAYRATCWPEAERVTDHEQQPIQAA